MRLSLNQESIRRSRDEMKQVTEDDGYVSDAESWSNQNRGSSIQSFVDLLFILLCTLMIILSESIRVGAVETDPAKVGAGGASAISADEVQAVLIYEDELAIETKKYKSAAELARQVPDTHAIVLITTSSDITHHRVMKTWSDFQKLGRVVKLGASQDP